MIEQKQTYSAEITASVDSHEVNENYRCLRIDISKEAWFHYGFELVWLDDKPFPKCLQGLGIRPKLFMANIMPTDDWVRHLVIDMVKTSPTFREWLFTWKRLNL